MKTFNIKYIIALFAIVVTLGSCEDLNVENLNDPDFKTAFSNPDDVKAVSGGLFNSWFMALHSFADGDLTSSPAFWMLVTADAGTCSWGNFGMRDAGREPRIEFNNKPNYSNAVITEDYYKNLYSVLSQANDVLKQTEVEKMDLGADQPMVTSVAYLFQGLSLGYLGLVFDKNYIVTETTDLSSIEPAPYKEVIEEAVNSLDKCIKICEENDFTIPSSWLPGEAYTSKEIANLANTFAARLLVYSARNKVDDNATDWQKVYDYAKKGVKKDFAPLADDVKWFSYYQVYANYDGWGQIDMYIIHMMDPSMPATFPADGSFSSLPNSGEATSADARLLSDYQYMSSCPFRADRGTYFFSSYRYKRLDTYLTTWKEPVPEIRKDENNYLLAEAAAHINKLDEAAAALNTSARVTRGGLPAVPENKEAILAAVHYERMIELMISGFGIQYFQMRKSDLLQKGSILHFPIPGAQLEVTQAPYYTFGATTGVAGVDYSNGGWK